MLKLRRDDPWFRIASGIFLILVCVSMVITLIPGMTGTTVDPTVGKVVAKVGNQEITTIELQEGLQQLTRSGRVPAEMVAGYASQVLDDLVLEKATQQEAERLGIHITEAQLQDRLRQIPDVFPNGKFIGKQQYEDMVFSRTGQTASEFERKFRTAMATEQLRKLVTDSIAVSPEELNSEVRAESESFVLSYVLVDPENLKKEIATPDPLVQAYFDKNKNRYQLGEKRSGKLLVFDRGALEKTVTIPEADMRKYYQDHADSYRVEERIAVSHILIKAAPTDKAAQEKAKKKIEELAKQIAGGADFAAVATKNSEDTSNAPKGGDLGFITKGQTVPPFEAAAFGLKPGTVSAPVLTDFGYHLIKVREHQQAHVRTFDEARAEIEASLKTERVQAELTTKAEAAAAELRKAPGDIEKIAAKYLATVSEIPAIQRTESVPAVAGSTGVVQELFTLEKGWVGKATTIPAGLAVPMLAEIQPARQAQFNEVTEKVRADYVNEQARSLALIQAQGLAQALEKQEKKDISAAAKAAKLTVKTSPSVTRVGNIEGVGPMSTLMPTLRNLQPGGFAGPIAVGSGQLVYQVASRTVPPEDVLNLQKKTMEDRLRIQKQNLAFNAYQENLKKRLTDSGDLVIHEDILRQATSTTTMPVQ